MSRPTQSLSTGKLKRKTYLTAWLFLLPGIAATIWLRYFPIAKVFFMSLYQYDALNPPGTFVGFANYKNLFAAGGYWEAWENTFVFLLLHLLLVFWVPLVQAIFLNEIFRGRRLVTTIYLITTLVPMSVNVIVWKFIWHPDYGFANQLIQFLGGEPELWLSDPNLTKFAIIFPGVVGGGVGVLLYLTAIQGIPQEIYEAASLEGCVGFSKIRHIVLPNIKFILMIQLILACITSMQILDIPFQYASGGPNGASTSMGIYIYNAVYSDLSYGKASAASVTLFFVIAVVAMIQMKLDQATSN